MTSMVVLEYYKFSRYGFSDLASPGRFRIFSHGCRMRIILATFVGGYVLDNGDSYSRLPNDVDQPVRLFFHGILVLVLLLMFIDYFNGCTRARGVGIALKLKLWENLRRYFHVYGLVSIFGCL